MPPLARSALLPLPLLVCLLPGIAGANPPEDLDEAASAAMSLEELRALGLGQSRGDPVPVPPGAPLDNPSGPLGAKQGVIYLNFDGGTMKGGWDNSKTNTTQIDECVGSFSAYGAGSKRAATVQATRDDWAPFNMVITETRPGTGDYTMCMIGPTNPFGGGVLGIAPLDCNDSQTHNNIVYAFHSANDNFGSSTQATTVSQEVAHSYGLEHVNDTGDIMNPYNAGSSATFKDKCTAIDGGGNGIVCGSQHSAQCGSNSQQNGYKELMALFGPSAPDNSPPTVAITYPGNGEMFEAGASFDIAANASDDQAVQSVTLYSNGSAMGTDNAAPYSWGATNIPEGTYEFWAVALDAAGNSTQSASVTITVTPAAGTTGGPEPTTSGGSGGTTTGGSGGGGSTTGGGTTGAGTTTTGGSGGGATTSGGGSGGGSDGGGQTTADPGGDDTGAYEPDSGGALPPGFGSDGRMDGGCACATGHDTPPAAWFALALLGLVRRRRR